MSSNPQKLTDKWFIWSLLKLNIKTGDDREWERRRKVGAFILNSWKSNLQSAVRFKYFSRVQSVVPQAGSCDLSARDHASVQVYSTHLFLDIFSHQLQTLGDSSPVFLWQKKSYLTQFTLVKQKVSEFSWLSVVVLCVFFFFFFFGGGVAVKKHPAQKVFDNGHPEPVKNVTAPAFMNIV